MGILLAGRERQIERRDRSGDVERHIVLLGQHRDRVGADLVRDIAVGRDAVRAHHHAADSAGVQEVAGHVVGDQRGRDVVVLQFPNGEARALQKRAGLVGEDVDLFAGCDRRADHAERGAVARRCQRAGIAMGENGLAIRNERRAVLADAFVDGDVFEANLLRFCDQLGANLGEAADRRARAIHAAHAFDGPKEIHRGGARAGERLADFIELAGRMRLLHSKRDAHGGRNADGRRAANHHGANRFGHLFVIGAGDVRSLRAAGGSGRSSPRRESVH